LTIALPELLRELDQPAHEVLLTWFDRGQAFLVSVSRSDLTDFVKHALAPSDQNFLVEKNLESLAPVIAGKRARGEVTQRTNPNTAQPLPLIELTRDNLEQGLKLYPVVATVGIGVEAPGLVGGDHGIFVPGEVVDSSGNVVGGVDQSGNITGIWADAEGSWADQTRTWAGALGATTERGAAIEKLRQSDEELTVISSGIAGSVDLSSSISQSFFERLRREFRNAVAIETRRFGAFMAVATGEVHIASFRPDARDEGHALRALRAADAIQQKLRSYLDPDVPTLPVTIGVHTAIGKSDPVAIAAMLEERALAGAILMSRATFDAAGGHDAVVTEPAGLAVMSQGQPFEMLRLIRVLPPSPLEAPRTATTADRDSAEIESTDQRPAAYRFGFHDGKIDVLPEQPEIIDRELALDLYTELVKKAQQLHERLLRTNSARHVAHDIEGLLSALSKTLDDLRPGVLLSRVRAIEADRAAFDTEEARAELFADAFAMMDGALQTARDLLAVFPIVRRVEAERLALDLDRHADAVPILRERMDEIQSAAEQSSAATQEAIEALAQNDSAIEEATDPILRTSLVADRLLVVRNFLGSAAGVLVKELSELGGESWSVLKSELPKGVGFAARVAPYMGLVTLVGLLAGPAVGIAAIVPSFKGIASAFRKFAIPEEKVIPKLKPKLRPKAKSRK
jgi:class 3 adenylate cyclase